MLVVWAVGAAVTYIMLPVNWFMETIGFLAVFTEAMLGELIVFPFSPPCSNYRTFHAQDCRNSLETTKTSRHTA
jgi:hypothetical protein